MKFAVGLPSFMYAWSGGPSGLLSIFAAGAAAVVAIAVLLFVLLLIGIAPRIEWGDVKINFERLPHRSRRRSTS